MKYNLTRRDFLGTAGLTVVSMLAPVGALSKPHPKNRLNVLFITADDLGFELSCYGETLIQTPNTDKLAASGVQFQIAYVAQASCSPSRSAMFTGLHTHSTGQYGLTNTGFALHPELRDKTIPNLLKPAGYRTGIIGKLHVAPEASFRFDFRDTDSGKTRQVRWVAERVEQFLQDTGDQPFFLMVNYSDPHAFRRPEDRTAAVFMIVVFFQLPISPIEKTIRHIKKIKALQQIA